VTSSLNVNNFFIKSTYTFKTIYINEHSPLFHVTVGICSVKKTMTISQYFQAGYDNYQNLFVLLIMGEW